MNAFNCFTFRALQSATEDNFPQFVLNFPVLLHQKLVGRDLVDLLLQSQWWCH